MRVKERVYAAKKKEVRSCTNVGRKKKKVFLKKKKPPKIIYIRIEILFHHTKSRCIL